MLIIILALRCPSRMIREALGMSTAAVEMDVQTFLTSCSSSIKRSVFRSVF